MKLSNAIQGGCALTLMLASTPAQATKICVDPGHGGSDPGAVGCGLRETDINLDTGKRLRTLLQAAGYQVVMTRDTDVFISLSGRASYANSNAADRFVSIHSNSASSAAATGIETFCASNGSSNSFDLRDEIQSEMIATWPLANRGGKTASFTVLTATAMPATLSELGFIVNCGNDATYLGSPEHRQEAAVAHLHALQIHLGQAPSTPTSEPAPAPAPAPSNGELKGAVFQDLGSGTDDMSVRLDGARVSTTGASTSASIDSASWTLSVPAGIYTVNASKDGFEDNQRSCTVSAGAVSWCSIGLVATAPGDPPAELPDTPPPTEESGGDAPTDPTDPAQPADPSQSGDPSSTEEPPVDMNGEIPSRAEPVFLDAEFALLGIQGDSSAGTDLERSPQRVELGEGSGCSQSAGPGNMGSLLLLIGLAGLLRLHRRVAVRSLVALAALAASSSALADAASPWLGQPRVVLAGEASAPLLSPDGQRIAFGGPELRGLYVVEIADGRIRTISSRARAGYQPSWTRDGSGLALRLQDRPFSGEPLELHDLDGRFHGPRRLHRSVQVIQDGDRVWLQRGKARQLLAPATEKFFAPQLSPDGKLVLLQGLATGLYLYRLADGVYVRLGQGDHPSFSADGRWLVFDRSSDDGQQLTGSEILRTDLHHPRFRTVQLTDTPGTLEQYPSLSADGHRLAYQADGALWIAEMRPSGN